MISVSPDSNHSNRLRLQIEMVLMPLPLPNRHPSNRFHQRLDYIYVIDAAASQQNVNWATPSFVLGMFSWNWLGRWCNRRNWNQLFLAMVRIGQAIKKKQRFNISCKSIQLKAKYLLEDNHFEHLKMRPFQNQNQTVSNVGKMHPSHTVA